MKILFLLLSLSIFGAQLQAQKKGAKKGSSKKSSAKKSVKKSSGKVDTEGETEFEELNCFIGGACTFSIVKGDTLIYTVSGAGSSYDLSIVPIKYTENAISDFNYFTSDGRNGHVVIGTTGIKNSTKYITFPNMGGELKLNDASFLWLTGKNFEQLSNGEEIGITIDNKAQEAFSSPAADAVTVPINYKGKQLELDGFILQNKEPGAANRVELDILNISYNLLIIKADYGNMSITLKEVREKKFKEPAASTVRKAKPKGKK
jgi:hypothetical protein